MEANGSGRPAQPDLSRTTRGRTSSARLDCSGAVVLRPFVRAPERVRRTISYLVKRWLCRIWAKGAVRTDVLRAPRSYPDGTMDRGTIGLASKLLAKAQVTTFAPEAAALTERAYRLLAEALNTYDAEVASAGPVRRRERRHRSDRRAHSAASRSDAPGPMPRATTANNRRTGWIESPTRGQIDLHV